ncbi:unnamed protein product [Symbiodinium sp. CCMP2592]|nr:unnamed protein product [Symbiodinium sp. CCMP2592]CAE7298709.1 unnamed protein product [Symbiodinium sp. CCMP2592]
MKPSSKQRPQKKPEAAAAASSDKPEIKDNEKVDRLALKTEPAEEDVSEQLRMKRRVMEILGDKDKDKTQSSGEARPRSRSCRRTASDASTLVLGSAVYCSSSSASEDDNAHPS